MLIFSLFLPPHFGYLQQPTTKGGHHTLGGRPPLVAKSETLNQINMTGIRDFFDKDKDLAYSAA
jgi:hypothetical protein